MKTTTLAILLALTSWVFSPTTAHGQNAACKVWTRSGAEGSGEVLQYKTPILQPTYFDLDGVAYPSEQVKFFQNRNGYIANLGGLFGYKSERYAMRIVKGKVDIYEEIDVVIYTSETLGLGDDGTSMDPLLATGNYYQYYSMDNDTIKKYSYRNLKLDLASNETAMGHLHRFRNLRWLQRAMVVSALGIITADIASQEPETLRLSPVSAFGFILGGSSFFLDRGKRDSLMLAGDAYNE